jgi:hypothetical protein
MKNFMLYRHLHKLQRENLLDREVTYINCNTTIEEYISKRDWRIYANSNTSYSYASIVNNTAGKVIANYWLDKVYSPEEGRTHRAVSYTHLTLPTIA